MEKNCDARVYKTTELKDLSHYIICLDVNADLTVEGVDSETMKQCCQTYTTRLTSKIKTDIIFKTRRNTKQRQMFKPNKDRRIQ